MMKTFVILMAILTAHNVRAQESCTDLIARIWERSSVPYKVWDSEVSTVEIRPMVDGGTIRPRSSLPTGIMMGGARIVKDLPLHQHKETEIYYVLKGRGQTSLMTPNGPHEFEIEAGSFFYLPSELPHYTVSDPDNPIELLYIFPRDSLNDIQYVFDGPLSPPREDPIIGKLPALGEYPPDVEERVLIDTREQVMKHLLIPPEKEVDMAKGSNRILFVRQGRGLIAIDGVESPISSGSYLYLEGGTSYSFKSSPLQGLDILTFE